MRVTVTSLREMKKRGEKIAVLTAYDYPTAKLLDEAGVPAILVGDSLGMVVLGHETTIPVTMEDMIRHAQAVVRGVKKALVVVDMPFMSFQVSAEEAVRNAGRLIRETGAQAVKPEGGEAIAETVSRIVGCGIPVMGHIGLTPQSVNQLGGYRVVGKSKATAVRLLADALALERAGAFALVLETIPAQVARLITGRVKIPTIGIGAGAGCDGQVQVLHDILGLYTDFVPKHTKRYADLAGLIGSAVGEYIKEVKAGGFPTEKESFLMDEETLAELNKIDLDALKE
jgi:3-methyl-2-oxobutanoate hydroxymethyltransferase